MCVMHWILIAFVGALVAIHQSDCIVLPATTTEPSDKAHLEPGLDALIREIFAATTVDIDVGVVEENIDEKPRIMKASLFYGMIWFELFIMHISFGQICEGRCVPVESSCDIELAETREEDEGNSGEPPDDYSDEGGGFFDIRFVVSYCSAIVINDLCWKQVLNAFLT